VCEEVLNNSRKDELQNERVDEIMFGSLGISSIL
jgi:hypothetical protein